MLKCLSYLIDHVCNLCVVIIIIGGIAASFGIFSGKSNLEKFNSIDINLSAAGIDKEGLQSQFKKKILWQIVFLLKATNASDLCL